MTDVAVCFACGRDETIVRIDLYFSKSYDARPGAAGILAGSFICNPCSVNLHKEVMACTSDRSSLVDEAEPLVLRALGESGERNKELYQYDKPDPSLLEAIPLGGVGSSLCIDIDALEFTSLCPVTGQPDYGKIVISYGPNKDIVESKSLKLYLMGYRQYGCFHEGIVAQIAHDLGVLLKPFWLRVEGNFGARGGIAIKPTAIYDKNQTEDSTSTEEAEADGKHERAIAEAGPEKVTTIGSSSSS